MTEIIVPNARDLLLDDLSLEAPAQINRSSWTGRRKVVGQPGTEVWRGSATIDLLTTEEEERPWRVFLFGLQGPIKWFRWPLPCASHIGPKPTVASGASDGYTLPLTGMQADTRILKAGQYLTVPLPSGHARACMLMADLRSDGSGNALATLSNELTEVPTLGVTVETTDPYIPMSLVEARQGFSMSEGVSGASFAVEEAL